MIIKSNKIITVLERIAQIYLPYLPLFPSLGDGDGDGEEEEEEDEDDDIAEIVFVINWVRLWADLGHAFIIL